MTNRKPSNIFISYARSDAPKVKSIVQNLISRGLINNEDKIFKEEDLPLKHKALRNEVRNRIQSASKLVVIWDKASSNSPWVNYEVGLADALGKPIIAVLPEKVAFPNHLQDVQIVRIPSEE